ncbi:MAG: hypothetical protein M1371_04465 [Actinobacteria bacterium]|nr:hypothetical protein [Actinomycetota bacterium]
MKSEYSDPGKSCKVCHAKNYEMFGQSYHGKLVSEGQTEQAPTCVTCHGSHGILKVENVQYKREIINKCTSCHEDAAKTYYNNYHGKEYKLKAEDVATLFGLPRQP